MIRISWVFALMGMILPILVTSLSYAEVIELPEEELAKESVLPVFDRPASVMNRRVVTAGRIDLNLLFGLALSEPIHNVQRLAISGYYNTSESHSFGVLFAKNSAGLSTYANQLESQFSLDFTRAPAPQQTIMADWNAKMFYGKMSLTKNTVFNLSLYSTLAGGIVQYAHKSYPALAPGIGQKFYFTPNIAFRFDMRLYAHQAPIPFLDGRLKANDPVPEHSEFDERITYTTVLDAGLTVLF